MIIDHNTWETYTPSAPKLVIEQHTIQFAQRNTPEHEDWYEYQASKPFGETSVIMTTRLASDGVTEVIQAVTYDASEIFPAGFRVIEETAYTGSDPRVDFSQHVYDPIAQTIGDVYVPPPSALAVRLDAIEARLDALERR